MLDRSLKRLSSDGQVHLHADLSGIATGPCNDMVVSSDGTAYVGNFGFDEGEDYAQASLAIVYADGRVLAGPSGFDFPNGTVIDPAGRRLIVAESYGRRLTAFSIEENGALTDRREFADLGKRVPDGICLDAQGGIWVADPRNRSCFRVLEGGEVTEVIELEFNCFACMLGGSDRRTLFMMTAPAAGGNGLADGLEGRVETVRVEVAGVGLP
jgi:sugar lactone lactonase YvrE